MLATIKDSLFIDSSFFNNFLAKAMETFNNLQNRLPTINKSQEKLVPEKKWTNQIQNLLHICIFSNLVFVNISYKKQLKSDFQKT